MADGVVCRPESVVVDYLIDGSMAGSVLVSPWNHGRDWFVYRLQVRPEHREQGIGSALMRAVIANLAGDLYVYPEPFNDEPVSLELLRNWYFSLGFEHVGSGLMVTAGKFK